MLGEEVTSMYQPKPDFMLRDPEGYPVAVIDVENLPDLSRDAAMEMRRTWIEYGYRPRTPYILLLSQDAGYLWKLPEQTDPSALPAYEFPMSTVIRRYWKGDPKERLYGVVIEMLIYQWLLDLTISSQEINEEPEKTLALSGFKDSIKGATIVTEDEL